MTRKFADHWEGEVDGGTRMTLDDWQASCAFGAFNDDDGYGHPGVIDECGFTWVDAKVFLKPSRYETDPPLGTTHVVWFNR